MFRLRYHDNTTYECTSKCSFYEKNIFPYFFIDNIVKISTGLEFILMEWETGKNVKKSFKQFWPLEKIVNLKPTKKES